MNFRGSTGFGQDGIESLLGNIGTQDVKDVHVSIKGYLGKGALVREGRGWGVDEGGGMGGRLMQAGRSGNNLAIETLNLHASRHTFKHLINHV